MKVCASCGAWCDDEESECLACGSTDLYHKCPKCSAKFDGEYCIYCGYSALVADHELSDNPTEEQVERFLGTQKKHTTLPLMLSLAGMLTCIFPLSVISIVICIKEIKKGNTSKEIYVSLAIATMNFVVLIIFVGVYGRYFVS